MCLFDESIILREKIPYSIVVCRCGLTSAGWRVEGMDMRQSEEIDILFQGEKAECLDLWQQLYDALAEENDVQKTIFQHGLDSRPVGFIVNPQEMDEKR